jgi:hypothetical protein
LSHGCVAVGTHASPCMRPWRTNLRPRCSRASHAEAEAEGGTEWRP